MGFKVGDKEYTFRPASVFTEKVSLRLVVRLIGKNPGLREKTNWLVKGYSTDSAALESARERSAELKITGDEKLSSGEKASLTLAEKLVLSFHKMGYEAAGGVRYIDPSAEELFIGYEYGGNDPTLMAYYLRAVVVHLFSTKTRLVKKGLSVKAVEQAHGIVAVVGKVLNARATAVADTWTNDHTKKMWKVYKQLPPYFLTPGGGLAASERFVKNAFWYQDIESPKLHSAIAQFESGM